MGVLIDQLLHLKLLNTGRACLATPDSSEQRNGTFATQLHNYGSGKPAFVIRSLWCWSSYSTSVIAYKICVTTTRDSCCNASGQLLQCLCGRASAFYYRHNHNNQSSKFVWWFGYWYVMSLTRLSIIIALKWEFPTITWTMSTSFVEGWHADFAHRRLRLTC